MQYLEFESGRALKGGRLDATPFGVVPAEERDQTDREVGFRLQGLMGAFRPLFPEAKEGLLAAEEDAVVG